jgi:flagellar biosynthesis/type III secretory pathway chaperone
MSRRIHDLTDCLTENEHLLKDLAALLDDERSRIVNLDLAGMESCREKKERLLAALAGKKSSFKEALEETARELSLPAPRNLSALLEYVPTAEREQLVSRQKRIFELADSVNRINLRNRDILLRSLSMVNRSLEFFAPGMGTVGTYSDSGRVVSGVSGGRFIRAEM